MIDPTPLWDFADPGASEQRFREAADASEPTDRLVLMTQVARALGLQERFDEGHAVLDDLSPADDEVATRIGLERGRLLRSAGRDHEARLCFEASEQAAQQAGLEALRVDAIHMLALVSDPADRLAVNEHALDVARASVDSRARDWDAALLNNIGMAHADAGDFDAALAAFESAVAASRRIGDVGRIRVARWTVAWAQRNLGRYDEALRGQRELRAELDAAGDTDPYVDEELALLEG